MLAEDLEAEKLHLDLYEKQLDLVADNTPLRLMIEQVIVEEATHIEELDMYLRSNVHNGKAKAKV